MLEGDRVLLRPPRDGDVQDRMRCGHDPEVIRGYGVEPASTGWVPMAEPDAQAWIDAIRDDPNPLHWVVEHDGRLVGSCRLHSLDVAAESARYAVGLEDRRVLGHGLGTEATRLVLSYGIEWVGLRQIDLRVLATNERALGCYRRCGFREQRRAPRAVHLEGAWHDDLILSISAEEWPPHPPPGDPVRRG
jgi:RimJ/RimL family protein N-acetyltransferase